VLLTGAPFKTKIFEDGGGYSYIDLQLEVDDVPATKEYRIFNMTSKSGEVICVPSEDGKVPAESGEGPHLCNPSAERDDWYPPATDRGGIFLQSAVKMGYGEVLDTYGTAGLAGLKFRAAVEDFKDFKTQETTNTMVVGEVIEHSDTYKLMNSGAANKPAAKGKAKGNKGGATKAATKSASPKKADAKKEPASNGDAREFLMDWLQGAITSESIKIPEDGVAASKLVGIANQAFIKDDKVVSQFDMADRLAMFKNLKDPEFLLEADMNGVLSYDADANKVTPYSD
jgi:hypothetical protein